MVDRKIRIVSFNICGIKGILSRSAQWLPDRSFKSMFDYLGADIICFQETKIQTHDITKEMALVPGFNSFFTCSITRKGYSGVAIYVRDTIKVLKAEEGLTGLLKSGSGGKMTHYREKPDSLESGIYPEGMSEAHGKMLDGQGRTITLDIESAVIIGVYCPADSQGNMSEFRDEFYQLLDWRIHKLKEYGHKVILLGDLNVAREPRDSAPLRDELLKKKEIIDTYYWKYGTVPRKAVNDWVEQMGFQDSCRKFHEDRIDMYTCWDQQKNCRPANFGSRIDYILVDKDIECVNADIMPQLIGSDHCPLFADVFLDLEPQGTNKLPYLSRNLSTTWSKSIVSFFKSQNTAERLDLSTTDDTKKATSPSNPSPKNEKTPSIDESMRLISTVTTTSPAVTDDFKSLIQSKETSTLVQKRMPKPESITTGAKSQQSISQMFGLKSDVWKQVNKRLEPPLCEHGEPCIPKTSMKPPHKGERFWMCPRSMGGKVNKERKYRCRTFIWDSERDLSRE